jgi:hypothetical protein
MGKVLLLCVVAVFCVMVLVYIDRYRLELLRNECDELKFEIESRNTQPANLGATSTGRAGS